MKKSLTFKPLVVLLACLSYALGASAYDFPDYEHGMYFNYLDDGTVEVTYYDEDYNTYSGYVTIPTVAVRGAFNQTEFDVTRVGKYAFRDCSNLTGVTIPVGIKSIGQSAFWYCTQLTTVTIPYSVTKVEYNAFGDCSNLKTVHIGDGVTFIGGYAFDSPLTAVYSYAKTPPTIDTENAFKPSTYNTGTLYVPGPFFRRVYAAAQYWSNFTNVDIIHPYDFSYSGLYYVLYTNDYTYYDDPDKCRVVHRDNNYNSYSSTNITVPEQAYYNGKWREVEAIGDYAFKNCTSLKSVSVPNTVKTIFHEAFYGCTNLQTVVIGSGCEGIGTDPFYNCRALTSLTCYATTPPRSYNTTFPSYITQNATLYVPASAISAYKNANNWKNFTNIKMIPGTGVEINATNFPDSNFRNYLLGLYPGGYIPNEDLNEWKTLDVSGKGISNMKGIEFFTELENLKCYSNSISSLDLSQNTKLLELRCYYNNMTSLYVNNCTNLTYLDCAPNKLSTLNLSNLTALKTLICYENNLTSITFASSTPNLESVSCYSNNFTSFTLTGRSALKTLNISNCASLKTLSCFGNKLSSLNVKNCPALTTMYCYGSNNTFSTLDLTGTTALTYLDCAPCPSLTSITNLGSCTAMKTFYCYNTALTDLSAVSNMADLEVLSCHDTKITSLTVNGKSNLTSLNCYNCPNLTSIRCYNCALTNFDCKNCPALTAVYCWNNPFTSFNVSDNTALTYLDCGPNSSLTTITGLASCTAMKTFYCYNTALTNLSAVSGMTNLETLSCYNTKLTSLTVQNKSNLTSLSCYSIPTLTSLRVTGNSKLTTLKAYDCPALKTFNGYLNKLSSLDVTGNTAMTTLDVSTNNSLSSITDLANCTALTTLNVESCNFSSLTVSSLTNLTTLNCSFNNLSSINVSALTKLSKLYCQNNNLTSLNVTSNTALTELECHENQLTSLNVSNKTSLQSLYCHNNKLTSLNVQGCSALSYLGSGGNKLTSLYVQGCNSLNDVRVHGNKFTEAGMSTLINSLPTRSSSNSGKLCVVNYIDYDEQNVITANQIAAAKAKYWYPKKWNGSAWVDYSLSTPGDVNGDGVFNITDVTELTYLLLNGDVSVTDRPAADYNGDGVVNISDVTDMIYYLLNH